MGKNLRGTVRPCKNAPNCDGEVKVGSKDREGEAIVECTNCRQVTRGWHRRTPTDVLRYLTELRKRNARMEEVRDDRGIEFKPTYRR